MNEKALGELDFASHCDDTSKKSGGILDSVNFVRLSAFEECRKSTVLSGEVSCCNQVFRRFRLRADREVVLDFWHRGFSVDDSIANEFFRLVSSPQSVSPERLAPIADVLGPIAVTARCQTEPDIASMIPIKIESAEVRTINSKNVLFVFWSDINQERMHISLFVDSRCDGLKVDEIHFSIPADSMESVAQVVAETLESIQWNILSPPPIPGFVPSMFSGVPAVPTVPTI